MKKLQLFSLLLLAAISCTALETVPAPYGELRLIPAPASVSCTGWMVKFNDLSKVRTSIDKSMAPEQYVLTVSEKGVKVRGGSDAGVFYGLQTVAQQMAKYGGHVLCGVIEDAPRYEWRGFMLDEARHFFGKEKVMQLIEEMARLKMNRLHWHLTDAQGWRIEIKSRPLLTEVGAAMCHSNPDTTALFYTQDEIREIVDFAASHHVEIIPEIDVPGHVSAATKSYPEISGGGTVGGWPGFTLNIARKQTMDFLRDVLGEVAQLFPGEYLHIGGDEVSYGSYAWLSNPEIKAFMDSNGYSDVLEAEGHFIREVAALVDSLGKKVAGWNDVQGFGLDNSRTLMMWWRHNRPDQLTDCLRDGFPTVLCPRNPLYYDYVQAQEHTQGAKWPLDGGFSPLCDVYAFPDAWTGKWNFNADDVLGLQANLWTEKVHNEDRFDFMVYPRLAALAESCWSMPQKKDYSSFNRRMQDEYEHYAQRGIRFCDLRKGADRKEPLAPIIRDPKWVDIQTLEK